LPAGWKGGTTPAGDVAYDARIVRRNLPLTCLLLVIAAGSGVARAGSDAEPSGLDLLERCHALQLLEEAQQPPDGEVLRNYGYCLGYVVGFVSGFAARDAVGEAGRFCPPADARIADFVAAIQAWLVHNPEALEQMGALVTLQALQRAFPCAGRAGSDQ
jgi:hypothetical protein